ncbi:hypothetical protein ACUOA9_14120, partial [Escherichia sp. HC-TM1]
ASANHRISSKSMQYSAENLYLSAKNVPCQIILVDNDLPNSFSTGELSNIIAHYSSVGEDGLPLGLIDDL